MSCPRTIDVQRFHDGELPLHERAALLEHIATCEICAKHRRELESLSSLLSGARRAEPRMELVAMLRAQAELRQKQGILRVAGWVTAAAAAVLVAVWLHAPMTPGEVVTPGGIWQTAAVTPDLLTIDPTTDPVVLAQWMVDELSTSSGGELR